jgi:hypothetical protein
MKLLLLAGIQETEFVWNLQAAALPTAPSLLGLKFVGLRLGGGKKSMFRYFGSVAACSRKKENR